MTATRSDRKKINLVTAFCVLTWFGVFHLPVAVGQDVTDIYKSIHAADDRYHTEQLPRFRSLVPKGLAEFVRPSDSALTSLRWHRAGDKKHRLRCTTKRGACHFGGCDRSAKAVIRKAE